MELFHIFVAGLADRLRGAGFDFGRRIIDQLFYGWVLAVILNHSADWLTPIIAVAFAIGSAPGWGDTSGSIMHRRPMKPEELNSWQVGVLKNNKWLSAFVRGFMWGALPTTLGYFTDPNLMFAAIVMPIAYISAAYLAGFVPSKETSKIGSPWAWMEALRGFIAGGLFTLVTIL